MHLDYKMSKHGRVVCWMKIVLFWVLVLINGLYGEKVFGTYYVTMSNLTDCPGAPKPPLNISIVWTKKNLKDQIELSCYIPKPIGPLGGDFTVNRWDGKKYVEVFTMNAKKICETFVGNVEASSYWPKLDGRCYLMKGEQKLLIRDGNKVAHIFSGNYMAYGKYKTRVYLLYGKHFLGCKEIYAEFFPLDSKTS